MEQTTTWLCPVCERVLDCKDLIIDGCALILFFLGDPELLFRYFDEILKDSPESVEDVIVESNGEWHTSNNKYGSATWRASHPALVVPLHRPPAVQRLPSKPPNSDANGQPRANTSQIVVLDSDDEDEGQVKRELSPSFASGSSVAGSSAPQQPQESVIDLTLDSDSDESPPPRQNGKRKAADSNIPSSSPTEQIWKKSKIDSTSSSTNGSDPYGMSPTSRQTIPLRYPSGYQTPSISPGHPHSTGSSSSSNTRLPGINSILPPANGGWA